MSGQGAVVSVTFAAVVFEPGVGELTTGAPAGAPGNSVPIVAGPGVYTTDE
jgi:hypothetical protein